MSDTLTNARNRNERRRVRMRQEQEERREQARLQKIAISDQAFQKAANTMLLYQRQPWWWQRHGG
jgi:hypothetical protein